MRPVAAWRSRWVHVFSRCCVLMWIVAWAFVAVYAQARTRADVQQHPLTHAQKPPKVSAPSEATEALHAEHVTWLGTPWHHDHPHRAVQRIVSLAPSLTEIVFALQAGDRIVGVTRYDDYPPAVATRPRVGGFVDPDVEAVLALKPDVILAVPTHGGQSHLETLQRIGLRIMIVPAEDLVDLPEAIHALARLLHKEADGRALVTQIDTALNTLRTQQQHMPETKIMWIVGHRPWVAAGPGSFLAQLLPTLHARNAVIRGGAYPTLDLEAMVAYDPEVIIDTSMGQGSASDLRAEWQRLAALRAVRSRRVIVFAGDSSLLRLGPRLPHALARVARAVRETVPHAP